MHSDPLDLQRFLITQAVDCTVALSELQRDRRQRHWIWFVLPPRRDLGISAMSCVDGIIDLQEARRYVEHLVLGARRTRDGMSAKQIVEQRDPLEVHACRMQFADTAPEEPQFGAALDPYLGGSRHDRTLALRAAK